MPGPARSHGESSYAVFDRAGRVSGKAARLKPSYLLIFMPAVDCVIQHGTIANSGLVNEPNILVQSLTVTPAREKKTYKGGSACTEALRFSDPTLSFDFDGYIKTVAGLADQHPGTTVAALANYTGAIFGFESTQGIMIYEDPSRELTPDDPAKTKFKVMQYPHVA